MKSSCYFVFSHSVLLCPNLYSIKLHNSLRTCSILVLVLSTAKPSWTPFCDGFVSLIHGFSAMTDCRWPSLSPVNLCMDPIENCIVDNVIMLHSTVRYMEMCLLSHCLETDCITSFCCCMHVSRSVYQAVAWQCVDQICYNNENPFFNTYCFYAVKVVPADEPGCVIASYWYVVIIE
jgi:hypothetical protein